MSRQDPGAATGQMPYAPARCECGHLVTLHAFNTARLRAACTVRGVKACGCRLFVAEAASRS